MFVCGIINTYNKSRARVQQFIITFGVLGGLYISTVPLIIFIGNNYVEAKNRHEFVFVAVESIKCFSNIGLSIMLNREKSEYNEISYDKKSFMPEDSRYF
jgi:ribose/xylose/arabinose/galactoside ABC-type transport system permease subunit